MDFQALSKCMYPRKVSTHHCPSIDDLEYLCHFKFDVTCIDAKQLLQLDIQDTNWVQVKPLLHHIGISISS
jgi:hypothetical protein